MLTIPVAVVRAALAERRIPRLRLAEAAGVSAEHVSRVLNETVVAGELTAIKLQRGLRRLDVLIPGFTDLETKAS